MSLHYVTCPRCEAEFGDPELNEDGTITCCICHFEFFEEWAHYFFSNVDKHYYRYTPDNPLYFSVPLESYKASMVESEEPEDETDHCPGCRCFD